MLSRCNVVLLIFAICLACAEARADITAGVKETVLDNGLTILTKEVRVAPVVSVNVFYRVGSRNEHTGITGISHLLEHMMFKGSQHFPQGRFEQLIHDRGGINNAATTTDYTYYWELLQSDYLDLALRLEADRMRGALFNARDLVSEMPVVRSEMEGRENSPDTLLWQLVDSTAFQAHPYQWPIIGWRSDVEAITRDQIYAYYQKYYAPNNATVVLVGDFDTASAVALVKKYFGALKPLPKPPSVHTQEPVQRGERTADLSTAGSAQRVLLSWKIPSEKDPDIVALDVLEQILSGGRSSRIYQALVESGIATDAFAYSATRIDPSLFYAGATAQANRTNAEMEKALMAEIQRVQSTPPEAEELQRAKRQIEAAFVFSNDDVRSQAQLLGRYQMVSNWRRLSDYLPSLARVTPADVQRVAKKYLIPSTRTAGYFTPEGPPVAERPAPGSPGGPANYRTGDRPPLVPVSNQKRTGAAIAQQQKQKTKPPTSANSATNAAPVPDRSPRRAIKPVRYTLGNGVVLIVLNNPANSSVSISGSLNAGGWLEGPGEKNVSDVTADMLSRGTATRTSLQFASAVEDMGAALSISSEVESTRITGRCLSRDFEKWTALLADALRNPVFPEQDLERLKAQDVSFLQQQKESPAALAEREFMNRLYPEGHPYHPGDIDKDIQSYKTITAQDLKRFHNRYYGPKGMILTVVGDVTPEQVKAVVEQQLGGWPAQDGYRQTQIPDVPARNSSFDYIRVPDKSQTNAVYGWPGGLKRSDKTYYAAVVMNEILGGGSVLTSRLGQSIRGKMGLVYDVGTGFQATLGEGPWEATLGANPANAEKAVRELIRGVDLMKSKGPTQEEVRVAKQYIVGVLSLRLATNAGVAGFLLSSEFYNLGLDYLNTFRDLYGSVTAAQVTEAARKYLHPESATLVVAGPAESFPDVTKISQ
ncbi:MAG: insulinase family protein [Armatimonadetes bacterium]|nr:insulinase family protein [Armatimonadota bacterium]